MKFHTSHTDFTKAELWNYEETRRGCERVNSKMCLKHTHTENVLRTTITSNNMWNFGTFPLCFLLMISWPFVFLVQREMTSLWQRKMACKQFFSWKSIQCVIEKMEQKRTTLTFLTRLVPNDPIQMSTRLQWPLSADLLTRYHLCRQVGSVFSGAPLNCLAHTNKNNASL